MDVVRPVRRMTVLGLLFVASWLWRGREIAKNEQQFPLPPAPPSS